ncbi:hypothetical protein [Kutzneria albida]|nr:hypothetical protein [Kutzneria albida]
MPNRTSLIRRLAELRSSYTGETDSSVLPAISQGGQLLDPDERAQLLSTLAHNWVTRALGENSLPPLPARIRQAVLPDATTRDQRELESGILAAAGRAVNYLHLRRPADLLRPARVFRMVRSLPGDLVLHIEPPALAPLMLELMPRITADDVLGLPGLRARLHRRHVELYLVDTDPPATVLISNVSYRQWLAAMAFVESAAPVSGGVRWLGNDVQPLTPQEAEVLASRHRAPGPAHLTSALLRRALVFGDALWFSSWANGCATAKVEWPLGPSLPQVASKLIHPVFGLPGDIFRIHHPNEDYLAITDEAGPRCADHPLSGAACLVLRPTHGPDSGFAEHVLTTGWHEAAAPWDEWAATLTPK